MGSRRFSKREEELKVKLGNNRISIGLDETRFEGFLDRLDEDNYEHNKIRGSLECSTRIKSGGEVEELNLEIVPLPGEERIEIQAHGEDVVSEEEEFGDLKKDETATLKRLSDLLETRNRRVHFKPLKLKELYNKHKDHLVDKLSEEFGLEEEKGRMIKFLHEHTALRFPGSPYKDVESLEFELESLGLDETESRSIRTDLVGLYEKRFRDDEVAKEAIIEYVKRNPDAKKKDIRGFFQTSPYNWFRDLREIRKAAGLEVPLLREEQKKRIIEMVKNGKSISEATKELKCCHRKFWDSREEAYKEIGVEPPKSSTLGRDKEKMREKIYQLNKENPKLGAWEIGKKLQIGIQHYLDEVEIAKMGFEAKVERKKDTKRFKLIKEVRENPGGNIKDYASGEIGYNTAGTYLRELEDYGALERNDGWHFKDYRELPREYLIALEQELQLTNNSS